MNSPQIYLLKRQTVNYIKSLFKKPGQYLPVLLVSVFIIFGAPFTIKMVMGEARAANLGELLVYIAGINIILGIPSFGTIFKMKANYWSRADSKYIFSYPYTFPEILRYGLKMTMVSSLAAAMFQIIYFIFIAKVAAPKVFFLVGAASALSVSFEYLVTYLLYANEKISFAAKRKIGTGIQIVITIIMISLAAAYIFAKPSMQQITEIVMSDAFRFIPLAGWPVNIYSLFLFGPTTAGILSLIIYISVITGLFIAAIKSRCTGKFIEPAVNSIDRGADFAGKAESGTLFASSKAAGKNKFKRTGIHAIMDKMATEDLRRFKLPYIDIAISLAAPVIYFFTDLKNMYPLPRPLGFFAACIIYYIVGFAFFSKTKNIIRALNSHQFMLLPYSPAKIIITTTRYSIARSLPAFSAFCMVLLTITGTDFEMTEIVSAFLTAIFLNASHLGSTILLNTGKTKHIPSIFKNGLTLILMYIPISITVIIAGVSGGLDSPSLLMAAPAYLALHNLILYILAARNYKYNEME